MRRKEYPQPTSMDGRREEFRRAPEKNAGTVQLIVGTKRKGNDNDEDERMAF